MRLFIGLCCALCSWFSISVAIAGPSVAVSIAPLYGLVSEIGGDEVSVDLLIAENTSPHEMTVKPSVMRKIGNAELVIWIGHGYESSLRKAIGNLSSSQTVLTLAEHKAITVLPNRSEHAHAENSAHEEHGEEAIDPHLWLSPHNMIEAVHIVAHHLSVLDSSNSDQYVENARVLVEKIERLSIDITAQLAPLRQQPFMVYHDALQYFEREFGLTQGQVVTMNPGQDLGAASVMQMHKQIDQQNIRCLFSEPQFGERTLRKIAEGGDLKIRTLDPIGQRDWLVLMQSIADSIADCLNDTG